MLVKLSSRAKKHLNGIEQYLLDHAPYQADDVVAGIIAAARRLEQQPKMGRIVDDEQLKAMPDAKIRQLLHGNYRILCIILEESQTIEIQSIRHTSQNF